MTRSKRGSSIVLQRCLLLVSCASLLIRPVNWRLLSFLHASPRGSSWLRPTSRDLVRQYATAGQDKPSCSTVEIAMDAPLDGRIGVSIQGGRRTVSRLTHEDAFQSGWRLGDVILEVNGQKTADNEGVRDAVKALLAEHAESGCVLRFKVQRQVLPPDYTRQMVKMTPGTGGELTVTMAVLLQSLMAEAPVVVYLDGTIRQPKSNLSEKALRILNDAGVAYKVVDASDEKFNPGVRAAMEGMSGDPALPQLFLQGKPIGNGFRIDELAESGELQAMLKEAGAPPFQPKP